MLFDISAQFLVCDVQSAGKNKWAIFLRELPPTFVSHPCLWVDSNIQSAQNMYM